MKMKYMATLVVLIVLLGAGGASAKSLYVIEDINAYQNIPIGAYDIQTSSIPKQTTSYIPDRNGGAVGITIDTDSAYLFVTFEFSGTLDIVNGTTMIREGQVTAPGAGNLAGIVVDQDKQKVYAIDRNTGKFYSYLWDATTEILTLEAGSGVPLTGLTSGFGLALDETNDLLYVADGSTTIRYYDTATWTKQGEFTVTPNAMGIAIDYVNGYVYCGGWYGTILSKYDLNTNTETTLDLVTGNPIGFAVDQDTGKFFVTTYGEDKLRMMDSDLNVLDITGDLGNPTGVCVPGKGAEVSYNPLNLAKTDGVTAVAQGGTLTDTVSYDNSQNNNPVTGVTIVDTLPAEVNYVSCTGGGVYDSGAHTVTWTIGTVPAGDPGASFAITVNVNPSTAIGTVLDNAATIGSAETGPTTQHDDDTEITGSSGGEIPEFPTIAIPMIAILGLAFVMQRRREE